MIATCVLALLTAISPSASAQPKATAAAFPPFKVAGHDSTAFTIVVAPSTTEQQLTALINGFRAARANGSLNQLIPPTTARGSKGPYAVVMLFVMSDPRWATSQRLHAFINPTTSGISAAEREFGKRVLAYYYYTYIGNQDIGSLGYEAEGHRYTAKYKKLF
jgi:hypothetical protein